MRVPGHAFRGRQRASIDRVAFALIAVVVSGSIGLVGSHGSALRPAVAEVRAEFRVDLRHLVGKPEPAAQLQPYVQAVDSSLAAAIARAAVQSPSDDPGLTSGGTVSDSDVKIVSPGVATVGFAIDPGARPNGGQRFVGDAVLAGGRWKLSWATVCMLLETESHTCPNPPHPLPGAAPLPRRLIGQAILKSEVPGLIRPEALAVEPDGDLLIVDADRDQILRWMPDGALSVFAGTGEPGLSGVGGPATRARLPAYFGAEVAVAANGTVYATGGSACGLLEITPAGILERMLTELCNTSGVALGSTGALFVSGNDAVYRYQSGALTKIASSRLPGRGAGPAGVPSAVGFSPADLALAGNGDLVVYSNGAPRSIWRLSPSGELSDLGIAYADGMATAPDGTVLIAGHGGSIERVTSSGITSELDLLSTKIIGYGVPGTRGGFQPDGIAVARSGAIFVDTFSGNGWTVTTLVAEIPPSGQPFQLRITTPVLDTLPPGNAVGFPSTLYPPAVPAKGSDLSACPSQSGLQPFGAAAVLAARRVAAEFNAYTSSFWGDLHSSDRSWWQGVVEDWTGEYDNDTHTVERAGPASADTFAPAVAAACGARLVRESEVVVEGPSAYSFQVTHLFFLDRHGHPLVYFQAT